MPVALCVKPAAETSCKRSATLEETPALQLIEGETAFAQLTLALSQRFVGTGERASKFWQLEIGGCPCRVAFASAGKRTRSSFEAKECEQVGGLKSCG